MKWLVSLFLIFVSMSIWSQSRPIHLERFCYDSQNLNKNRKLLKVLPEDSFPWGVCMKLSGFTEQQKDWTRRAMWEWNESYKRYKKRRWGTASVWKGIPAPKKNDKLFYERESCEFEDFRRNDLIYLVKELLRGKQLAHYKSTYHNPWFAPFSHSFWGVITVRENYHWTGSHFVNVMIHELGHALGIPHLKPGKTEIMLSHGFSCGERRGRDKICKLRDKDFESFLWSYDL